MSQKPVLQRTLLIVGAHPDDETFGCGGTLAHYARKGVKVFYACATRGEAGSSDPEHMEGFATMGDMRWSELQCAAKAIGMVAMHLGYRDSGMPGSEDNKHPQALISAPVDEVAGRVVRAIRELKPQVIITSDPSGGYGHPDHIAMHNATVRAFQAAGDPKQYPEAGPPFQPQKLYYPVFRNTLMKWVVRIMPLFGQDPRHQGRNKDIDMTVMARMQPPVHAVIRLSKQIETIRDKATACYASQLDNRPRRRTLISLVFRFSRQNADTFMRANPPVTSRRRERDLFANIE